MWLLEGTFDGETDKTSLKLLKPGRTYPLGRKAKKPLQLVVASPKVSGEHVTFIVGDCPASSLDDPDFKPTLTLKNNRTKPLQIIQNETGERIILDAMGELELVGGESIALVTAVYVGVHWRPIICTVSPSLSLDTLPSPAQRTTIPLKLLQAPQSTSQITHHLATSFDLSPAVTAALIVRAELVNPDWLREVVRLAESKNVDEASELEQNFFLPDSSRFQPKESTDSSLLSELKAQYVWQPKEERKDLFKGWRFLFPTSENEGHEASDELRRLVNLAGGEYEVVDLRTGAAKWDQALSKNKSKWQGRMAIVGSVDPASDVIDGLRREGLRLIKPDEVVQAVLLCDTAKVDSSEDVVASLGSIKPAEPTQARRKLPLRRVGASRETTPAPLGLPPTASTLSGTSVQDLSQRKSAEPETQAKPRKPLIKRTHAKDLILGVDDPTIADIPESQIPSKDEPKRKPPSKDGRSRSNLLKRRLGTSTNTDDISNPSFGLGTDEMLMEVDPANEPPLKKYRALFEETDPDRVTSQYSARSVYGSALDAGRSGQTTEAYTESAKQTQSRMDVIQEEPEELQSVTFDGDGQVSTDTQAPVNGTKSDGRLASFDSTQAGPQNVSSSKASGAEPGKPDTDAAFLQALASTKKGKKKEDEFDREFNNLRISKPAAIARNTNTELLKGAEAKGREEVDYERVLAEFEDEENILGNFMVIMEYELPLRDRSGLTGIASLPRSKTSKPEWTGRPDFKKFKKKASHQSYHPIELIAEVEDDFGTGLEYWKNSQSQNNGKGGVLHPRTNTRDLNGFMQIRPASRAPTQLQKPRSNSHTQKLSDKANGTQMKKEVETPKVPGGQTRLRTALPAVEEGSDDGSDARRKSSVRGKGKQTVPLFLDDESQNGKSQTRKSSRAGSRATSQSFGIDDEEDFALEGFSDIDFRDDFERTGSRESTLPSAPKSTSRSTTSTEVSKSHASLTPARKGKKRGATSAFDESDGASSGMAFRGFGRGKRGRI